MADAVLVVNDVVARLQIFEEAGALPLARSRRDDGFAVDR